MVSLFLKVVVDVGSLKDVTNGERMIDGGSRNVHYCVKVNFVFS